MMHVFGRACLAGLKVKNLKICARSTLLPVSVPKITASRHLGTTSRLSDPPQEAIAKIEIDNVGLPAEVGNTNERVPYWQKIPIWKDVPKKDFLSYQWQMKNTIQGKHNLVKFLEGVLPASLPTPSDPKSPLSDIKTRDDFIAEIEKGIKVAPMSIRLTPHILSVIDWEHPFDDPIIPQFVPIRAAIMPDHPKLVLDSLHEKSDSPVDGLVHRYPDKALFLATSICNVYCKFCTRSYAVGVDTESVSKASLKPSKRRWEAAFQYIQATPTLTDIVVSGGDCFILTPEQIHQIGTRLLSIPHIKRIRFATKGLAVCPSRILDPDDSWTAAITAVSNMSKKMGKMVAIHTHFNHPNEMTWISRAAARKLSEQGVMVRNQTVLLRGVNDDVATMSSLIRNLADMTITPYYVYQCDMVAGLEDLRTPLQTILDLEQKIRGSIAGFMTPQFIVDLPGGGGKRLAASYRSYDRETGISSYVAPAVKDGDTVYRYYDPLWSVPKPPADWDAVVEGEKDGVVNRDGHEHAKFADLRNWTSLI